MNKYIFKYIHFFTKLKYVSYVFVLFILLVLGLKCKTAINYNITQLIY